MDLSALGTRIKQRREHQKLRQIDIANALRISAQAVSKWERGENAPDISLLVQLSALLAVNVEWLLTGIEEQRETFEAVVFCTALNGFARRAGTMPPHEVAAWANGVHYVVTEALLRYGGVPIKCVGDGLLAFFSGQHRAQRALQAALEAKRLFDNPDLVIGLHAGDIFLGAVGHPEYVSSDIIGTTVNTAFLALRWAARHSKVGIALTVETTKLLKRPHELQLCGRAPIDGLSTPLEIYEPTSLHATTHAQDKPTIA